MNIKIFNFRKSKYLEKMKWLLISIFLILPIFINNNFFQINIFICRGAVLISIMLAIIIALTTEKGKNILTYINASKNEMKKIIWPQYKETLHTTCIIIFIAVIMSLLVWGIDSIIFRLITFLINLRF
ncbi:preprotein translocase subunit SecE [Buchnera aphidicola (Melanaphis sacchari)]|uniref:Protein translocase subunit SecE n=1 Tax=Buchnera aphidicola (Melanaphis sacchari) TaxID=2173854 RepID=A0A2U8DHM5_9GAMM|nr:preprotein translocase subunit SecE [Buchnera aphidicola]AWH90714.1 preprotein translocase subunit SecE [Buchnera aphidicola (Melanaphis sacchari)]